MAAHRVRALLIGRESYESYGVAKFSRDAKLRILADADNLGRSVPIPGAPANSLINTMASARWKGVGVRAELFQQSAGRGEKPLKRLVLRGRGCHRAEATVLMRGPV
jgi:hypothetical protein